MKMENPDKGPIKSLGSVKEENIINKSNQPDSLIKRMPMDLRKGGMK